MPAGERGTGKDSEAANQQRHHVRSCGDGRYNPWVSRAAGK